MGALAAYRDRRCRCLTKERYPTMYDARAARDWLAASGKGGDVTKLEAYGCGFCGCYHVGHTRRL